MISIRRFFAASLKEVAASPTEEEDPEGEGQEEKEVAASPNVVSMKATKKKKTKKRMTVPSKKAWRLMAVVKPAAVLKKPASKQ